MVGHKTHNQSIKKLLLCKTGFLRNLLYLNVKSSYTYTYYILQHVKKTFQNSKLPERIETFSFDKTIEETSVFKVDKKYMDIKL